MANFNTVSEDLQSHIVFFTDFLTAVTLRSCSSSTKTMVDRVQVWAPRMCVELDPEKEQTVRDEILLEMMDISKEGIVLLGTRFKYKRFRPYDRPGVLVSRSPSQRLDLDGIHSLGGPFEAWKESFNLSLTGIISESEVNAGTMFSVGREEEITGSFRIVILGFEKIYPHLEKFHNFKRKQMKDLMDTRKRRFNLR